MKTILAIIFLISASQSFAEQVSLCKINLWQEKSPLMDIYEIILKEKGYEPVFNDSAIVSLSVSQAGFAETGCNDGSIFGDKNFKRVNAYAELRTRDRKVVDSVYGSDFQSESTTFNNPVNKRTVCATLNNALLNALTKIPNCQTLTELLKK